MHTASKHTSNIDRLIAQAAPGVFAKGRFAPLVEAAVRPDRAERAWAEYTSLLGTDVPGMGETRLFPLIAEALKTHGGVRDDPLLSAARRTALAQSALTLRAADYANSVLQRHGIEAVFTKGLSLQVTEYRNPVLRTFSDIDCCIRPDDIATIAGIAQEEGWHNEFNLVPKNDHQRAAHSEMTLRLPCGVCLDVHWVPRRAFSFQPNLIDDFFATAKNVEWRGRTWRVPSPTWRLIETVEHGVAANEFAPIRWLPDAVRLLENESNEFDWDFIVQAAIAARLKLVLFAGLTSVSRLSDRVPPQVLERLDCSAGILQTRELSARIKQSPTSKHRLRDEFLHFFLRAPGSVPGRIARFPSFLIQGAGRSQSLWHLLTRVRHHRNTR